jgi:hypothetical protein
MDKTDNIAEQSRKCGKGGPIGHIVDNKKNE